jgi:ADP-heptose:LPS heptosyltransferase
MDALTMLRPVTEYASALGVFENVHESRFLQEPRSPWSVLALRRRRYDLVCVPAPATRWQYAALAFLVGGKITILHRYGGLSSAIARAGGMRQVSLCGGHRMSENRRLVESLGLRDDDESYLVPASWRAGRRHPRMLGLHTGSMSYKGSEQKRWPFERFIDVATRHLACGSPVRAFFGPNEAGDARKLKAALPATEIVERPLPEAAQLLSECGVLLANDSGLAHLAAGLGVTTLVLFGMTDPNRCKPVGPVTVLRPSPCPPCFDEGLRSFACARAIDYRCLMQDLSVDYVAHAVNAALDGPPAPSRIEREGPLTLYGRAFAR